MGGTRPGVPTWINPWAWAIREPNVAEKLWRRFRERIHSVFVFLDQGSERFQPSAFFFGEFFFGSEHHLFDDAEQPVILFFLLIPAGGSSGMSWARGC
jgi:hypothetical protein